MQNNPIPKKDPIALNGGCHCGAVRFEIDATPPLTVHICNCSICEMSGFVHLIVPAAAFRLLRGEEQLSEYQFRTKVARHLFCKHCGVKSFYVPRSNPDGYSINVNCLELPDKVEIIEEQVDGRNWSKSAPALRHLSQ